ncbi:hypothetical protein [Xylanimonas ulmi]|uniref:Uncharacterized protein n=1 Tax=Xylanimonas ulmi TaxID=228973 RepID=A0A4Q7M6E6_9MICO|nr:hypothetical protein [Xylanibacterium ulmi]RZS62212.1 hypothetical protein EV386_2533 [Xylanibacterium ulmi]
MAAEYELRLREMTLPSGEITLADVAAIAARLQDLSTRVSRWVADIDGAGRGPRVVEDAAALRLSGVKSGSTVLAITHGVHDRLDFDTPFEEQVSNQFWDIVAALGTDAPPADSPDPVRESAVGLLDALQRAAPLVQITRGDGARVEFRPAECDRSIWRVPTRTTASEETTIVGRLEMVDLRASRLRIADDVGNRVTLEHVVEAEAVSREMVGQRTSATGLPTRDKSGRIVSIEAPSLQLVPVPTEWLPAYAATWELPSDERGPDPEGGAHFDDNEWESFLTAVKEA